MGFSRGYRTPKRLKVTNIGVLRIRIGFGGTIIP